MGVQNGVVHLVDARNNPPTKLEYHMRDNGISEPVVKPNGCIGNAEDGV